MGLGCVQLCLDGADVSAGDAHEAHSVLLVAVAVAGGHGEREPSRAIVTYEDWGGPEGWSASDEDDRGGNARGSGRTSARASRPGANPGGVRGREGSDGRRRHRCADRPWCGSRLCLTLDRSDATCAIIFRCTRWHQPRHPSAHHPRASARIASPPRDAASPCPPRRPHPRSAPCWAP